MYIADLHIHSSYSRATAKDMTPELLARAARTKGVHLLGTGDILHPSWRRQLRKVLVEKDQGIYHLDGVDFMLTGEVSFIYTRAGRLRKVHLLLLFPDFGAVEKLVSVLGEYNLTSDGRPTFGMDMEEFLKLLWDRVPDAGVIPAHIWTPHFSLFGSNSGFDSVYEAMDEELAARLLAMETGLSSDPPMNWRVSQLDRWALVSFSDAHSPDRIGREATVFARPLNYPDMIRVLREKDTRELLFTIEFYPEEGKYHYDGHRNCGVVLHPEETKTKGGICPVCGKPLTVGVLHRVLDLADRPEGERPPGAADYKSLIPLREIIGSVEGVGAGSKRVNRIYQALVREMGSELEVLLSAPEREIARVAGDRVARGVVAAREGRVEIRPGYDGEYGVVRVVVPEPPRGRSLF